MKNKVTIRDIARESNVSPATVSYVLNNKPGQKISEETRKKILQVVNLYNYSIDPKAKALAEGTSHDILFLYPSLTPLQQLDLSYFLKDLASSFFKKGYSLVCLPFQSQKYDGVSAIITMNNTPESFKEIANLNFVPLISLLTVIDDPLFFSIRVKSEKQGVPTVGIFDEADIILNDFPLNNLPTKFRTISPALKHLINNDQQVMFDEERYQRLINTIIECTLSATKKEGSAQKCRV